MIRGERPTTYAGAWPGMGDAAPVTPPAAQPVGLFGDVVDRSLGRAEGMAVGLAIGIPVGIAASFLGLYYLGGRRR